jgi:hypothetical protein
MAQLFGRFPRNLLFVLIFVPGLGCGKSTVKVEGKIISDGQAFQLDPEEKLHVGFEPVGQEETTIYLGSVNDKDLTFVSQDKGIPPGNYRIKLRITLRHMDRENGPEKLRERNRIFDLINQQEVTITGDSRQKFTVDVGKGTVSK